MWDSAGAAGIAVRLSEISSSFRLFGTLPLPPRFPLEGNDPGNQIDFANVYPLFHRREGARG